MKDDNSSHISFPFPFLPDNATGGDWEGGGASWGRGNGDVVQGALLIAIAMLGAALNLFLMLAILPNPRMRSVRQVLLVHLAAVGLVTSLVLTLPAGVLQLVTSLQASPTSHAPNHHQQQGQWLDHHHRHHHSAGGGGGEGGGSLLPAAALLPLQQGDSASASAPAPAPSSSSSQHSAVVPPPSHHPQHDGALPSSPRPTTPLLLHSRESGRRVVVGGARQAGGGARTPEGAELGGEGGGGRRKRTEEREPGGGKGAGPGPGYAEAGRRRAEEEELAGEEGEAGPLCTVVGATGVLLTAAGVWTVAALAWDKHRAIANPLHHPLVARPQTMTLWLALLWTLSLALATPPLLGGGDLRFVPALSRCGVHAGSWRGRWHALLVVIVGVAMPLALMLYCYTHIFRIARAQSSRIAATMLRMVTLIQAPIAPGPARGGGGGANIGMVKLRGTRAMATIVQLVGSCVASYVPWAVLLCHQAATSRTPAGLPAATAAVLLHAAPLTAATVYGLRNRNLRDSFARFVTRKMQRCWCRPRQRRRPSVKSLQARGGNSSQSALTRKQVALNGLSPVTGVRRTLSLQQRPPAKPATHQPPELSSHEAFLPRPHSYNVLASSLAFRDQYRDRDLARERERDRGDNSELHHVMEVNSEYPAVEYELESEYPGMWERETVT